MSRIFAVTGGAGFLGAALLDRLLAEGFSVRALARDPARFVRWRDRIEIVPGALDDAAALDTLAAGADGLAHCAGVTHARREAEYVAINIDGAAAAAAAAARAGVPFIHISSVSARAPATSAYAGSKFASEGAVREASGDNPWLALRLPALYGPGDRATLPYFRLVRSGFAPEPATRPPARASILFVEDAAEAVVAAWRDAPAGVVYDVEDEAPGGRSWREIGAALASAMEVRARPIEIPRPIVAALHAATRGAERVLGRAPTVRSGQINEFFHPDWAARDNLLGRATGWRPAVPLKEGFAKTVRWYQEHGLL